MERNLSVGEVFGTALSAFGARARVLLPIAFAGALLVSAVTALVGESGGGFVLGFAVDMAYFALVAAVAMVVLRRPPNPRRVCLGPPYTGTETDSVLK